MLRHEVGAPVECARVGFMPVEFAPEARAWAALGSAGPTAAALIIGVDM
jgi:hypothetical protein